MAGKGKRLYQPVNESTLLALIALNRASRPRCNKCGSSRLEIVSDEGYEEMVNNQRNRIRGEMGSTVLASNLRNKEVR